MVKNRNDAPTGQKRVYGRGVFGAKGGYGRPRTPLSALGWMVPVECLLAARMWDASGTWCGAVGGLLQGWNEGGSNRCGDGWECFVDARRTRVRVDLQGVALSLP